MNPPVILHLGSLQIQGYALFVALGFVAALRVRRAEMIRLGWHNLPGYRWLGVGGLLGAMVGAKLGMILFDNGGEMQTLLDRLLDFDLTGKTVVGGLGGGYIGVEITKKIVGIRQSTGDSWAVALPLGQGLGRIGCFLHGCCGGKACDLPWAVAVNGQLRHPTQLYEATLDLLLALLLWQQRKRPWPLGTLFRLYLASYAIIRFFLEFLRADGVSGWGPLSRVQLVCVPVAIGFGAWAVRGMCQGMFQKNRGVR